MIHKIYVDILKSPQKNFMNALQHSQTKYLNRYIYIYHNNTNQDYWYFRKLLKVQYARTGVLLKSQSKQTGGILSPVLTAVKVATVSYASSVSHAASDPGWALGVPWWVLMVKPLAQEYLPKSQHVVAVFHSSYVCA